MPKKEEKAEVVAKKPTFSESLTTDLMEIDAKMGLPRNFNVPKYVNNFVYLLNNDANIQNFVKNQPNGMAQVKANAIRGAFDNLDFMSGEVYNIPYGSTLKYMPSYKGLQKLAKLYSVQPIGVIYAEVVRQGDEFTYGVNEHGQYVIFKPLPFNSGAILGAFAEVYYENGFRQNCVMSKAEIDKCRDVSKSRGTVWRDWYTEQMKKTVLRRLTKSISLDFDSAEQRADFYETDDYADKETLTKQVDDVYAECEVVDSETDGE